MDPALLIKQSNFEWHIAPHGTMRVPGVIYADEELIRAMDMKVYEQVANVASLPGIVGASYAMPDAHWGYGFPIGGVAAFDPNRGGVVSAGGVGFDISCGVRTLLTGLARRDVDTVAHDLAEALYYTIPAGLGSRGHISLSEKQMDDMLRGGARWAVESGWGIAEDLAFIEERGCMAGARPEFVSHQARHRQREEMGTLGSGNHYLELQEVVELFDPTVATAFGLREGEVVVSIHCGSRGLGHQIGSEFLKSMAQEAKAHDIALPDRELACAPIHSETGQRYLGAMRAATNCALANRQILTHLTRETLARFFPQVHARILYDVSHNTCKEEVHRGDGGRRALFIHRKGATRAFGPRHPELPEAYRETGQPVLIGGSMGTESYVLVGTESGEEKSYSSACHGAGRAMSRTHATKIWHGRQLLDDLAGHGVIVRGASYRGIAEEAPGAYKDVRRVVDASDSAGLARKVARLRPLICIKG